MQLVRDNLGILILNLILTFSVQGISWQGHTSGLITGFLLTLVIYYPPQRIAPAVVDANTGESLETEYQD
jgi:membrane associated rhomboid family serine protease